MEETVKAPAKKTRREAADEHKAQNGWIGEESPNVNTLIKAVEDIGVFKYEKGNPLLEHDAIIFMGQAKLGSDPNDLGRPGMSMYMSVQGEFEKLIEVFVMGIQANPELGDVLKAALMVSMTSRRPQ